MGKDWLHWIIGGGGGSRNSRSATKKVAAESASAGCMSAVFHLFHSHHLQFPSSHRNHSHSHPFLQEEASTTTGVEAPRNSLELDQENLNFPVGIIKIKTKPRFDEINSSECNSPATKTPIVARLMGLDLLPQSTSPSISSSSPKCKRFLRRHDDDTRSLPETPRVSSSSSRRSDIDRHRLSLQINEECTRRGRFKQNENRNPVQRVANKHGRDSNTTTTTTRRFVGADITNTVVAQSRRDENLLLHKPAKKNYSNNIQIPSKNVSDDSGPRILLFSDRSKTKTTTSSSSLENHIPSSSQKVCKRVGHAGGSSSRLRKLPLPPRAAADRAVRGSRETNKLNLRDKILQVKKFKGPSPPPTKLPQKKSSQVSDTLSSKSRTQLSSKPSQSYNLTPPCDGGAALHGGGSSPEQRNYIQIILKHTGIINHANPLAKWHTPSHPIDPGIFHHLELSATVAAAADGGDTVLSRGCNRKLVFQLVDELLAEVLTPRFSLRRWVSPGGGFPVVEELCKRIESFPAAKCVVLEDIDSLIDTDLCKSRLNGCLGEEEEVVREIESEMVEWLVCEAVAVMGGAAAAEEQTETRVLFGGKLIINS